MVGFWTLGLGGESVTCEGSTTRWRCEHQAESVIGRVVAIGIGDAPLTGPNDRTKTEIVYRRGGRYAAIIHADDSSFRMPTQPSRELADADRRAWLGWAKAPKGTFTRRGPTDGRFWPIATAVTLLGLATFLATAWVHLRPPTR